MQMKNKRIFKALILIVFLFGIASRSFIALAAQAANDNNIWWDGVFHYQDGIHMNPLFPTVNESVTVMLRVNRDDITAARIRYWAGAEYFVDMVWDHNDAEYSYWKGTIPASTTQAYYRFKLIDGTDVDWYSSKGMSDEAPFDRDFTYFPVGGTPAFEAPDWVKNAVFYQIFPERFYNGDSSNDPPGTVPWGSEPTTKNFMGGDLQGIIDKLDYLNDGNPATTNDLGITAIYLNPIFESRTNHKYSTEDYENVDDNFGDNTLLSTLITEAHNRGIRVILDGVFNHTGVAHPFFDDVVTNGVSSPYYKFYTIHNWPIRWYDDLNGNGTKDDNEPYFYHWSETTDDEYLRTTDYDAWWGFAHLPNLVTTEKEIRDYFINDPQSIVVRWLNAGIDGWRLDVANEIEDDFWKAFRTRVKAVNPDAYIVGEFWGNAAKWLDGTMWDSTMNYRFRGAVQNFFASIDDDGKVSQTTVDELDSALYAIRSDYSEAAHSTAMNLIDSHDTWRFINRCGEDWTKLRAAVIFQMTYAGAPTIYYGTENGMSQWPGARKDPGNRSAMEWANYTSPNHDKINELYRKLIRIRLSHPALRSPHVRTLYKHNSDKVYAYARHSANETVIVVINNSSSPKNAEIELHGLLPDGTELIDQLESGSYTVISGKLIVDNISAKNGRILAVSGPDYSNIVINEFVPVPSTGSSEWVELYNKGTSAVHLGGCKIDDIISGGTSAYRIPNGTTIEGHGFRAFGRSFGLNNTCDSVNFIDPEGEVVDSYEYTSNPGTNKSFGRLPDGADNWVIFENPTKGLPNKKEEPTHYDDIVINEFLPAPSRGNSEWVELYNKGASTVDLSGCRVDDIVSGGTSPYGIPSGTTIEGHGYLLFERSFGLNNAGDMVNLIDPQGAVIDSYEYTSNPGTDKSVGRSPDGASAWGIPTTATPGASNSGFENIPPTADFTVTPSRPEVSQEINFDGSSSTDGDGTIVKHEWDWENDGTFDATGKTSTHNYTGEGTYKVTLRVTDDDGAKNKISKDITVTSGEPTNEFYGTRDKFAEENIYFVMTDRFVNGNTGNDHRDQGTGSGNPTWEIRMDGPGGEYANIGYMGGDFEGIHENADYIKEMGFTSIWITPLVDNPDEAFTGGRPCTYGAGIGSDGGKTGYHGYWGVNFYRVDEHYESIGFSFAEFTSKMLNDHGLKVVLDIVCNHGSPSYTMPDDQPMFGEIYDQSDILVADHQNLNPGSLDYSNPLHSFYNMGGGLAELSDLNENNPDVLNYLARAYLQWIDQGAYAFRIDTIAWMPHFFWKRFADRIRENHPDFFMFGENFNYNAGAIAQHQKPENGGISVLDFPGKAAINSVFSGGGSYSSLEGYLHLTDGTYTSPYELVTFYDNHDMARMNADENGFVDANNWLFTTRGIPCIYYGSEKRFMAGKSEHQGNRNYYGTENIADARTGLIFQKLRKIATIRKNSPALQQGLQVNISLGSNTASFYRVFQHNEVNQTALMLLNKGDSSASFTITKYMSNGTWTDADSGDVYNVTSNELSTSVPPHEVKVLLFNNRINNEEFINLLKALMSMSGEKVEIYPSPATGGMDVKVSYRALTDQEIECHWGINNWSGTGTPQGDIPMTWKPEKFVYECVIPVPSDATMLDMVFHNITTGSWDNNNGADWRFEVK
jgi:glycosidase